MWAACTAVPITATVDVDGVAWLLVDDERVEEKQANAETKRHPTQPCGMLS